MKTWLSLFAVLSMLTGCTRLFFYPHSVLINTPEQYGQEYRVENFQAADGTWLNAWFLPAQNSTGNNATVLFLHGNAENISTHFRNVLWLPAAGYNVLALDYRGYGTSAGSPTLAGMQLDIDAAMRHLRSHPNVDPQRIVVIGQSLGGALAIHYVAHSAYRDHIRAVVIDSAFYDYRQIAREKLSLSILTWPFQWLPWLMIDDSFSPAESIAAISPLPLLLLHGDRDQVIPEHHSRDLYAHAQQPKELWIVPGAGHIQSLSNATIRGKLVEFLQRHTQVAPR